ncbi:hypothetical protein V525_05805 [Gordonia alkanivorans CGMCC 6845]|uniref:Uncharacterized protein n=1 Tax=Gordonia alkanivorans CGMCC 6845 TaxID=1423140 RepID=W9DHD9_9ACTN|nr:hypothetical protein V525_05805 [Gordonia alkanivorans CGMCC 6845]
MMPSVFPVERLSVLRLRRRRSNCSIVDHLFDELMFDL